MEGKNEYVKKKGKKFYISVFNDIQTRFRL